MTRVPGASAITRLALLAVCLAGGISGVAAALARQDAPAGLVEVGSGPVRERSLALVGRSVYGQDSMRMTGYLTAVIGLGPELIFTDGAPSVESARFTYFGEVDLNSSTNRGDVTAFDGDGTLRIFFDEDGGATWDDPASFADGQPVAELSLVLHNSLQRQGPGVGVIVADDRLRQLAAEAFAIGDVRYRFGQEGSEWRLRSVGALVDAAAKAQSPDLAVTLSGSASVVARESTSVIMGSPAAP